MLNSEGKDINPARISSKPLVVITDDDKFDRIMQHTLPQYLYVRRTYSSLMKSTLDWRDVRPSLLWIDLPVGLNLRATKLECLQGLLLSLTQLPVTDRISCMCLLPWARPTDNSIHFPHRRWSRLLHAWKPETTWICSCKFLGADVHYRYRVFSSEVNIKQSRCGRRRLVAA